MHSLNPLLRAFYSSKFSTQCSPAAHYILLVPTTEFLLLHRDKESETSYADLVSNEDFLGSHVIRTQAAGPTQTGKDSFNYRDSKGVSKQFSTASGKTVVVKDNLVYCHRGFKTINKAQILHDDIYYPDIPGSPQWLLYYISRPLLGDPQSLLDFAPPSNPESISGSSTTGAPSSPARLLGLTGSSPRTLITCFRDILIQYPAIARHVQTPLDKLCQQFRVDLEKYNPTPKSLTLSTTDSNVSTYATSTATTAVNDGETRSLITNDPPELPFSEAEWVKRCLETLVLGAIDVFQGIDKQLLAALGSSTDLSGSTVEQMLEKHVTEIVHNQLLFPRLESIHEFENVQLGHILDQMADIDILQVGLTIEGGLAERRDLSTRVRSGAQAFNKMSTAQSPHEMIDVLLEVQKRLTTSSSATADARANGQPNEKVTTAGLVNADMLVSLLLLVLIRSPVRQLHSRLSYMRDFVFVMDVETGEAGYALSTFEAVLLYLSQDSTALRKASRANRMLRHAVRKGDTDTLQKLLDADGLMQLHMGLEEEESSAISTENRDVPDPRETSFYPSRKANGLEASSLAEDNNDKGLSHVFPFQSSDLGTNSPYKPALKKRVSMDTRSMSSSSLKSFSSRSSTARSGISIDVDTTPTQLARIKDAEGNSIMMKAVLHSQPSILQTLLSSKQLYPLDQVLEDCDDAGTTLLSAALQLHETDTTAVIVDYLSNHSDLERTRGYLRLQDTQGRTAAHYLFNAPNLITALGNVVPWTVKDKNGCTPLFALSRSYDHDNYVEMITSALHEATRAQVDGEPLHLGEHVDGKGNTLLHVTPDVKILKRLLTTCDADPNAANEKKFTPLMMASKYARIESIRAIFTDERTDIQARDFRGLTAVELAKDEDIRIKIDELVLLSTNADRVGRMTTIVRSLFVDDGTTRMIVKSGAPTSTTNVRVTTCRRSLADFENLARWLAMEEPASWIPIPFVFRNPFQLPSKPSRLLLRDTQLKLNGFLAALMQHPVFSNHETLWEFLLVPDIDPNLLAVRANMKADLRMEKLREDFDPLPREQVPEVELFTAYATDQVISVFNACTAVLERINSLRNTTVNVVESHAIFYAYLERVTKDILPTRTIVAYKQYRATLGDTEASPPATLFYTIQSVATAASAVSTALARPAELMTSIEAASENLTKQSAAAARILSPSAIRWPSPTRTLSAIGGLLPTADGQPRTYASRQQQRQRDAQERVRSAAVELDDLGRDLAATRQTVAVELASWQSTHAQTIGEAVRQFARRTLIVERARYERMRGALRTMRSETK